MKEIAQKNIVQRGNNMDRSLRRTYGGIFGTAVLPEMPQTILDELNELDDADDSDFLEFEDQSTEAENTVY